MPSRQRCADLLALTPWDEAQLFAWMAARLAQKPFTNQLNHERRWMEACRRRDDLLQQSLAPEAIQTGWRTYEAALAKAPDDWDLHNRFGVFAMQFGRPDVAVEQLRIAVQSLPWLAPLHDNLGKALACRDPQAGAPADEAIAQYRKALEIDPNFAEAYNDLGKALAGCGRADEAIAQYRKSLEIRSEFAEAHSNLADALASSGQFAEAIAEYRKVLEIEPDNFTAIRKLGLALAGILVPVADKPTRSSRLARRPWKSIHWRTNVLAGRRTCLSPAAAWTRPSPSTAGHWISQPESVRVHVGFANPLAVHGEVEEAVTHYRKALESQPDDVEAHNNLGLVLAGRGQIDEAIAHCRKAVELAARLRPGEGTSCRSAGRTGQRGGGDWPLSQGPGDRARRRGGPQQSRPCLGWHGAGSTRPLSITRKRLRSIPVTPPRTTISALSWRVAGRFDDAIAHYEKALEIQPHYAEAHNNLGVALVAGRGKVEEAIEHFQRRWRSSPIM